MPEGTVLTKYSTSDSIFYVHVRTAAGMTSNLKDTPVYQFPFKVVNAWGYMIGAGAAADTVKVQAVNSAGVARDITDAVDVSALADRARFDFGQIDDAGNSLVDGEKLRILTASDALCEVLIMGLK